MIFRQNASILRINGGEIFQQERVDEGHQENRQRGSRSTQETGCSWMELRKTLTANAMTEEYRKRGLRSRLPNNSEFTISCDLAPNRIFEKSESRGARSRKRIASFASMDFWSLYGRFC